MDQVLWLLIDSDTLGMTQILWVILMNHAFWEIYDTHLTQILWVIFGMLMDQVFRVIYDIEMTATLGDIDEPGDLLLSIDSGSLGDILQGDT